MNLSERLDLIAERFQDDSFISKLVLAIKKARETHEAYLVAEYGVDTGEQMQCFDEEIEKVME